MSNIPTTHWRARTAAELQTFQPYWERQLQESIRAEPDPAARFSAWLKKKAAGESTGGVRIIFIEEPYLGWAETVEAALAFVETETRERAAYEITHPNDD